MSDLRRRLLDLVQEDFPLEERPYLALAERLGASEEEVLSELAAMRDEGLLRDLSPVLHPAALGARTTLCAMRVPPERVAEVAAVLNAYDEVTHNYERDHEWNLWFTLVAMGEGRIARILREVEEATGLGPIRELPQKRLFKLRAVFRSE